MSEINIPITYKEQTPTMAEPVEIVTGQRFVVYAKFTFSEDWEPFTERTAVFETRSAVRRAILDEKDGAIVPPDVLNGDGNYLRISVFGVTSEADGTIRRYNGKALTLRVTPGGRVPQDASEGDPAYDELLLRLTAVEESIGVAIEYATRAADNAERAADEADEAAGVANAATRWTQEKAAEAEEAALIADEATERANTATANANAATERANTATANANAATEKAGTAASKADNAAEKADTATANANAATEKANAAASKADNATEKANTATANANTAAANAGAATENADTAAKRAEDAAKACETIAAGINFVTDDVTGLVYNIGIENGIMYMVEVE